MNNKYKNIAQAKAIERKNKERLLKNTALLSGIIHKPLKNSDY